MTTLSHSKKAASAVLGFQWEVRKGFIPFSSQIRLKWGRNFYIFFPLFSKNKEFWRSSASSQPLSQNRLSPSAVGLLRCEEQQVPITPTTVHCWQYCTSRDSGAPTHEMTDQLESQGVVSKTDSFLLQINKFTKWEKFCSIHKIYWYPPFLFWSTSEWRWRGTTSFS